MVLIWGISVLCNFMLFYSWDVYLFKRLVRTWFKSGEITTLDSGLYCVIYRLFKKHYERID